MFDGDYYAKLYVFMKTLEIPNFETFIDNAKTIDFENLGREMAKQTKRIVKEKDELQSFKDDVRNLIKKVLPQ